MSVTRRRPIDYQLDAFEEQWKRDPGEAMRHLDLEECFAVGAALFGVALFVERRWRSEVLAGGAVSEPEDGRGVRDLLEHAVEIGSGVEARLARFEREFGEVPNAEEFRGALGAVSDAVKGWKPPVRQAAPGLRPFDLTEEEAERLAALRASGEARLKVIPRAL